MKIPNVKPNNNSEYPNSFNRSSFTFLIFGILLPQYQIGSVYFKMSQKYTSYVHIGSSMYMQTTLREYNAVGYVSGTHVTMHLRPFLLLVTFVVLERIGK